jgi:hypothetical protein
MRRTSTLPTQMGDSIPPEATESVRTIRCNAEGMPTVEVANRPLIGANPGTTPGAVWATESDLLRATVLAQQSSSAKPAQGRCNEHELVDRLLSEGGGGGLGQQEVTSNSGEGMKRPLGEWADRSRRLNRGLHQALA